MSTICQTTLSSRGKIKPLKEMPIRHPINRFTLVGLSQQYNAKQNLPDEVFYVEGCWH